MTPVENLTKDEVDSLIKSIRGLWDYDVINDEEAIQFLSRLGKHFITAYFGVKDWKRERVS